MSEKASKSKEDILIELYIKNYITKTQYFETLERIQKEKK